MRTLLWGEIHCILLQHLALQQCIEILCTDLHCTPWHPLLFCNASHQTVLHSFAPQYSPRTTEQFAEWESNSSNSLEPTERLLSGSYQDWWPCSVLSVICCQTLRLRDPPLCVLFNAVIQLLLKSCCMGLILFQIILWNPSSSSSSP